MACARDVQHAARAEAEARGPVDWYFDDRVERTVRRLAVDTPAIPDRHPDAAIVVNAQAVEITLDARERHEFTLLPDGSFALVRQAVTEDVRQLAEDVGDNRMLDHLAEGATAQTTLVGRFSPHTRIREGDAIEAAVNARALHFFDADSGLAI